MCKRFLPIFAWLSIVLNTTTPMASAGTHPWQTYSFNGKEFREDKLPTGVSVAARDGYLPVVVSNAEMLREDQLPSGTGGVVIYCYIQRSGGKLQSHAGVIPMGEAVVQVSGKELKIAGRADAEGYLILALPPGDYEVRVVGFNRKIRVERGKNSLIAIRGGKRMVD